MSKILFIGLVTSLLIFDSCKDDDKDKCTKSIDAATLAAVDKTRLASDIIIIDNYLTTNGITALTEPNGIRYVITQEGTGVTISCFENSITVKYKGTNLVTGTVFDEKTESISFPLKNLILGWRIMLPKMKQGTKFKMYLPSGYGYGVSGNGTNVPANANLIFEIELVAVVN